LGLAFFFLSIDLSIFDYLLPFSLVYPLLKNPCLRLKTHVKEEKYMDKSVCKRAKRDDGNNKGKKMIIAFDILYIVLLI